MELDLERINNNNISLQENQKNFLETNIGKVINTTIDIGLRYLLPDLIENEVINIKDTLIKEGWQKGLEKIIDEGVNIGKSAIGIITGDFENIDQIKKAIGRGGIIESASTLLDGVLKKCTDKGLISSTVKGIISKGKNILFQNASSNLEDMLQDQDNLITKLKESSNNWRTAYMNKDFGEMDKEFKKLERYMKDIIPLEETINDVRKIENIHNIIKNNGGDFNLTDNQLELANILTK